MNNKKDYKETHEQSELFQFIKENMTNYSYWRGVYNHVILDSSLNTNDIVVYLNIYKLAYKKGNSFPISYWKLTRETNMDKANLSRCISKLEDKGYIKRELNYKYSYSIPINTKTSMLQIPIEFFDNMLINKKLFVNTLRALMLSYGNDIVPSYSACVTKMGSLDRRYYSKLKKIHNGLTDISLYKSLDCIEEFMYHENNIIDYEFANDIQEMVEEVPMKEEPIQIESLELVNYSNFNIENGEEIDNLNVTQFEDRQTYNINKFLTDKEGNKRGSPTKICRYGEDIRRLINVQDTNEEYIGVREYLYYYSMVD